MTQTTAAIEVVTMTDDTGSRYAFTREQLAEARVGGDRPADLTATVETTTVEPDLTRKGNSNW